MAGFCDQCGESFPTATSKFCGNCGKKRVFGNVEVVPVEPIVVRENTTVDVVRENTTVEEGTRVSLWAVPEYRGNLTLYDRVYGMKPQGVGKNVLWGKSFLKSVREYRRQHKKMQRNYRIVRGWFLPGQNEFVDRCLNSPSLRWDKSLKKELTKYCNEIRKSGPKEDQISTLEFPEEGIMLRWKTSDIVRHFSTIKKYRRSSKGQRNKSNVNVVEVETREQIEEPLVEVTNTHRQRVRRPSLKVLEQAG